jgi:hypothetical protein
MAVLALFFRKLNIFCLSRSYYYSSLINRILEGTHTQHNTNTHNNSKMTTLSTKKKADDLYDVYFEVTSGLRDQANKLHFKITWDLEPGLKAAKKQHKILVREDRHIVWLLEDAQKRGALTDDKLRRLKKLLAEVDAKRQLLPDIRELQEELAQTRRAWAAITKKIASVRKSIVGEETR